MALKTPPIRRWRRWLIGGMVAVAVLGVGGPFMYTQFVESNNPPPLSLSTPESAPASAPGPAPSASLDGTWTVASGSQAGYRVNQNVAGQTATTVGRATRGRCRFWPGTCGPFSSPSRGAWRPAS